jgi:hypothetical protein
MADTKLKPLFMPIQGNEYGHPSKRLKQPDCVPWGLVEDHEAQAQENHGQTLERLRERAGVSACECLAIIYDRPWVKMHPIRSAYLLVGAIYKHAGTCVCGGPAEDAFPSFCSACTNLAKRFEGTLVDIFEGDEIEDVPDKITLVRQAAFLTVWEMMNTKDV